MWLVTSNSHELGHFPANNAVSVLVGTTLYPYCINGVILILPTYVLFKYPKPRLKTLQSPCQSVVLFLSFSFIVMSQLSQGTIPAITALSGILGYVVHPEFLSNSTNTLSSAAQYP